MPRDDKVLSPAEAQALLSGDGVVEEMLDGLSTVPRVSIDRTTLAALKQLVTVPSKYPEKPPKNIPETVPVDLSDTVPVE